MDGSAAATFCATLVDEWARRDIRTAWVAPGSRSTPLLLALDANEAVDIHMFHDERSASFAALGHASATGLPGIVLCTSGTAATHFHAAVVEADLSAVPMIVCTADRPPELWDRGSPQTIDQTRLYGDVVRLFAEPGPADAADASAWRPLATGLARHALGQEGGRPGPVHANLSFRDPLVGAAGRLPGIDAHTEIAAAPSLDAATAAEMAGLVRDRSGVVVVGRGVSDPRAIARLAEALGWPVIADHQSQARSAGTINHADSILRHAPFADAQRPAVVLRFGEGLSSKALSSWISATAEAGTEIVALHQPGRLIDPENVADLIAPESGAADLIADAIEPTVPSDCAEPWLEAESRARRAVGAVLATDPATEAAVAVRAVHAAGADGIVVAASSMPIRYLEWFDSTPPEGTRVISNRGASGIDGVISTAIGAALTGAPTVCITGDVAFLHDGSGLTALSRRPIDLTIVVLDNDGGGIFSFLPQAEHLSANRFDRLFGTPHGTDLVALAEAHGLQATHDTTELAPRGVRVIVADCADRDTNVGTVRDLNEAVASALS